SYSERIWVVLEGAMEKIVPRSAGAKVVFFFKAVTLVELFVAPFGQNHLAHESAQDHTDHCPRTGRTAADPCLYRTRKDRGDPVGTYRGPPGNDLSHDLIIA